MLFSITLCAHANGEIFNIDLTKCSVKPCYNLFIKRFNARKEIKVVAWTDVVDAFNEGYPKFYPLFNIYNTSLSAIEIEIGMQLLDKNKAVLAERMMKTKFSIYDPKASKYKIYRTLNPIKLTKDIISRTKYVNIIVGK